jgi:hypothetical protein
MKKKLDNLSFLIKLNRDINFFPAPSTIPPQYSITISAEHNAMLYNASIDF